MIGISAGMFLSLFVILVFVGMAGIVSAKELPSPVIMGYQNWGECNANQTIRAAMEGVNVVIWFAITFSTADGEDGRENGIAISGGPDSKCMADVAASLDERNLPTTHLISIGGWNSPHPPERFSGGELFAAFHAWNTGLPWPYDGLDWDLEGNNNPSSPYNTLTPTTLNQMLDLSAAAKASELVVTLVPAQSYFDQTTSSFNTSLLSSYEDWHPEFTYRGTNCYAYLVAAAAAGKANASPFSSASTSSAFAFDAVSVQLYESWSRAGQALFQPPLEPAVTYLRRLWGTLTSDTAGGWVVDFGEEGAWPGLRLAGPHPVPLAPANLVVGLSRGSADGSGKSAFFRPVDAGAAYEATAASRRPRGFAFWNIAGEGEGANGTAAPLSFAPALNAFLHVRASATATARR